MRSDTLNQLAAAAYAAREPIAAAAAVQPTTREDHRAAETVMRELTRGNPAAARVAVIVLQELAAIGKAAAEAAQAAQP